MSDREASPEPPLRYDKVQSLHLGTKSPSARASLDKGATTNRQQVPSFSVRREPLVAAFRAAIGPSPQKPPAVTTVKPVQAPGAFQLGVFT